MIKKVFALWAILIITCGFLSEQDKALFSPGRNVLTNGGFELGTPGWVINGGTSAVVTTGASVAFGGQSLSWTAKAGNTATATVTIPSGLYGRSGVASCLIKTNSVGSATHTISALSQGTTTLTSIAVSKSTAFIRSSTSTFTMPTFGTLALVLTGVAATEPQIYIDDCYLGPTDAFTALSSNPFDFFQSSQVTTLANGAYVSFTTFSNSPAFTFTPGYSGTYEVYASVPIQETASAGSQAAMARITNTSGGATLVNESQGVVFNNGATAIATSVSISSIYTLTAGNSYVFDIQGKIASDNVYIRGDFAPFYMFARRVK